MKQRFTLITLFIAVYFTVTGQVTKINSNKSLSPVAKLNNGKGILQSSDKRLWVTDGTAAGTFQLSSTIAYEQGGAVLNGHFIFPGISMAHGNELWITDGTVAGTTLLKDIHPGTTSSHPDDDFVLLNGHIYFTADSPGFGRELWKTDGTVNGTVQVMDIRPGPAQSALRGNYNLFSTGTYLLLNVATLTEGYELWRSDGTETGTFLLKDINPGQVSSSPTSYVLFNNTVLFAANHADYGLELWSTDGTAAGTNLVKDIRPGTSGAFYYLHLFQFNGRAYFIANDGTHGDEIWSTDGTTANTNLLKDIQPGVDGAFSIVNLVTAIKMNNKFVFLAYQYDNGLELWESDGTANGTKMLKELAPGLEMGIPVLFTPYDPFTPGQQQLFQGNKFFFLMISPANGSSLWISDGSFAGTIKIKDINPAQTDGIDNVAYCYTPAGIYFAANNGIVGDELWKSDGTTAGTNFLADINPGAPNSEISFVYFSVNNKLLFQAQDGDHASLADLFSLDANGDPLPVQLQDFIVVPQQSDALLQWWTAQEINSSRFVVERSSNGQHFTPIGTVPAAGNSNSKKQYQLVDAGIKNSGLPVVYYRLISYDLDGKKYTSKVIALHLGSNTGLVMKLQLNPVRDNLPLTISGNTSGVQLSIHDVSGKALYRNPVSRANGQMVLPVQNLPAGTYLLIATTEGERKAIPFVKSK